MQSNELPKANQGSKLKVMIILSIVWLILGALIFEWLPLIPSRDSSVPDNYVTLDATSSSMKTRGDSGNIHLFVGNNEYIFPTGNFVYDLNLDDQVDLSGKLYVDTDNAYIRTPVVTGFGAYSAQLLGAYIPGFKWPKEMKKVLDYIPLTMDYKLAPCKSFFAWNFNNNAELYHTTLSGKACTVIVYKDFYWVMDNITVQEISNFGMKTTVFEHRSSAVNVLSGDKVSDDGFGNVVVEKSIFNRLSLARSFGMQEPLSLLLIALYLVPLFLLMRNVLNHYAGDLEEMYTTQGLAAVQKECNKMATLKTVFTVIGAIWFGGYIVTMLINMFALTEPIDIVTTEAIGTTAIQVMGSTANNSLILGILTGIFFHVPATFTTMTGYVSMLMSLTSLAVTAGFALFPALLVGTMSNDADKSYERFKLHSSHK